MSYEGPGSVSPLGSGYNPLDGPIAYAPNSALGIQPERTYAFVSEHGDVCRTPSLQRAIVNQCLAIEKLRCAYYGLDCQDDLGDDGYREVKRVLDEIDKRQTNALCELVVRCDDARGEMRR